MSNKIKEVPTSEMANKEFIEEVISLAEELQEESHAYARHFRESAPNCTHQDAINVYTFMKLAQLELRLKNLESPKTSINE